MSGHALPWAQPLASASCIPTSSRCCSLHCCLPPAEAEVVPVRQIDNSAVLSAQLARLASVKASRDDSAVAAALQVGSGWDRRAAV